MVNLSELIYSQVPSLQEPLSLQIVGIAKQFPISSKIRGVALIGSCSIGQATYRSDVDLLVIVGAQQLTYSDVVKMRDEVENHFESKGFAELCSNPLPIQVTVVLESVFLTEEPAMRDALKTAIPLFDPNGQLLKHQKNGGFSV